MSPSPIHLAKVHDATGPRLLIRSQGEARLLPSASQGGSDIVEVLHGKNPRELAHGLWKRGEPCSLDGLAWLAPVARQEIWAAGVTYRRSEEARKEESQGAAIFYDAVYRAARPELFFKATAERVVGHLQPIRIRADSTWNVPEPELTLVLNPRLEIVGYTLGNDVSSRDIEGENPLYLPQAKIYEGSCAIGPWILLSEPGLNPLSWELRLRIERAGQAVFSGQTIIKRMARSFADLVSWLGRELRFPQGCLLLTGTGIVPGNDFTLQIGDVVHIECDDLGMLSNPVGD